MFYYYLDIARKTGQDTIAVEKIACYLVPRRTGHTMPWWWCGGSTWESTKVGREPEGEGKGVGKSIYCGFCRKKQARQSKQT